MRTYTLELVIDFDTEEQYAVIKEQMTVKAREILAISMLIAGKRKPQIALHSTDFFHGNEDIELVGDAE